MLIPIRCFTCGAVIAHKYEDYADKVKKGDDPSKILDKLGIKRYCCRRMFLSNVDAIDDVIRYRKY